MINNFTSVITWLKDITSSILSWFFDTSNINKVLLFIVPLFVIGAIFVLFDFIVPMFFELPRWRLTKQITVMSPKNTYGLQINKHLIPRSPYSLRRYVFNRVLTGDVKSYSPRDLKSWSSKDIRPFTVKDFRNLAPRQIANFNIKPITTVKLGGLVPSEIRSFSVNGIRTYNLSSRVIDTHTISHFSSANNVKFVSPAISLSGISKSVDSHVTVVKSANAGKANN